MLAIKFDMAAFSKRVSRILCCIDNRTFKPFLQASNALVNSYRTNFIFKHLALQKDHEKIDYEYEVTKDPNDWMHVENLLKFTTVPEPTPKPHYPSGWQPMKEEALKLPYFVSRTKNHMLPIYLKIKNGAKYSKIHKIKGDIWLMHDDLTEYLRNATNKKIFSAVEEGDCRIIIKRDFVYYMEQWALSKGF